MSSFQITEQEAEFLPLLEEVPGSIAGSHITSRRPSRNTNVPNSNLSLKDLEDGIKPDEESSNPMINFIQSITSNFVGPSVGSPLNKLVNHRRHRSFTRRLRRGQKSSSRANRFFLSTSDCGTDREGVSPGAEDLASTLSFDSRIYPPSEEDGVSQGDDAQSRGSKDSCTTTNTKKGSELPPEQLQAKMVSVLESIKEYLEMEKASRSQEGSMKSAKSLDTLYEEEGSRTNICPLESLEEVETNGNTTEHGGWMVKVWIC